VREQIGDLDERFDAYGGEDVDYTLRAKRLAIDTLVSAAYVEHEKHGSFGPRVLKGPLQHGLLQFAEKWGFPGDRPFGDNGRPRVSVVMANRDHARWLPKAVESVLLQSYPFVELVVVDDGSRDDSADVLRGLQKVEQLASRLRVFRSPPQGATAAKNLGIRQARGDIITFQDADDESRPERIARQLEHLRASAPVAFSYTNVLVVGPGGRVLPPLETGPVDIERLLNLQRYVAGATLMARRGVWESLDGFDERPQLSRAYDYDLVLRATSAGMLLAYLDEPLYVYRRHGGNTCGNAEAMRQHLERAARFRLQDIGRAAS